MTTKSITAQTNFVAERYMEKKYFTFFLRGKIMEIR